MQETIVLPLIIKKIPNIKIKNKKTFNQLLKKGTVQQQKEHYISLRLNKQKVDVPLTIEKLMKTCSIIDLKVHEPRLEQVIKEIYQEK